MINLPFLTLLNGAPGSGKTTLMNMLAKQHSGLCPLSLGSHARDALLACHYPEIMPDIKSIDLQDPTILHSLIPGTGKRHSYWLKSFTAWLRGTCGKQILADITKRNIETLRTWWSAFIIDDLNLEEEAKSLCGTYGADKCLIIHLRRRDSAWTDEGDDIFSPQLGRHVGIDNNSDPQEMLARLEKLLGTTTDTPQIEGFSRPIR